MVDGIILELSAAHSTKAASGDSLNAILASNSLSVFDATKRNHA